MRQALIIDLAKKSHKLAIFSDELQLVPLSTILAVGFAQKQNRDFLIFGRGVVAGHHGIGLATATITGFSPQSQAVVEAKVEGGLAKALLGLELEAIAVINSASELTGLKIEKNNDYQISYNSANNYTGFDTWQTTSQVVSEIGEDWQIATISKFGEIQSKAASIVINNGFATSCGGLGATSGKLKLKYLALPNAAAKTNSVINLVTNEYLSQLKNNPLTLSEYQDGFSLWIQPSLAGYQAGDNFASDLPKSVEQFDAEKIRNWQVDFGGEACPGCSQSCLKSYSLNNKNPIDGGRSHQLSIAAYVSQFADGNMQRAVEFNETCHKLGLEHLYACQLMIENKSSKDVDINTVLKDLGEKEIKNNQDLIKGMVIPPWDPRGSQGLGLAMALNPSGPRYDVIEHDIDFDPSWAWQRHTEFGYEFGVPSGGLKMGTLTKERIASIKQLWKLWSAIDAIGVCIYASPPTRELRLIGILQMLESVTGKNLSAEEFFEMGRLRLALQREANYLFGLKDDGRGMPEKFFKEPITTRVNSLTGVKINKADYQAAQIAVFEEFDWDESGSIKAGTSLAARLGSLKETALTAIG
jgi:aldehyde:ferredoxin oxidoreductase